MRDPTQQATSWQPDSAFGLPGSSIVQAMRSWASVSGRMRKASASGVGEGVAVGVGDSVGVRVDVSVATAVGEAAGAGVPGGAVELGETIEETAIRELWEEAGLTARAEHLDKRGNPLYNYSTEINMTNGDLIHFVFPLEDNRHLVDLFDVLEDALFEFRF